jgi:hypothetical protein
MSPPPLLVPSYLVTDFVKVVHFFVVAVVVAVVVVALEIVTSVTPLIAS